MSPDHDAAGHIKDNADERREDDGLDGDHALSRLGYRVASRPAAARAPTRAWILGAGAEADQRRGAERFRSSSILVSMYFSRRRKSSLTRLTNVLCLSSRLFNPAAFDATDQTAAPANVSKATTASTTLPMVIQGQPRRRLGGSRRPRAAIGCIATRTPRVPAAVPSGLSMLSGSIASGAVGDSGFPAMFR